MNAKSIKIGESYAYQLPQWPDLAYAKFDVTSIRRNVRSSGYVEHFVAGTLHNPYGNQEIEEVPVSYLRATWADFQVTIEKIKTKRQRFIDRAHATRSQWIPLAERLSREGIHLTSSSMVVDSLHFTINIEQATKLCAALDALENTNVG